MPAEVKKQIAFYPEQGDTTPPAGDFDAFDIKRYARAEAIGDPAFLNYAQNLRNAHNLIIQTANPIAGLSLAYAEVGGQAYKDRHQKMAQSAHAGHIEIYDLRENQNSASQ